MQQPAGSSRPYLWIQIAPHGIPECLPRAKKHWKCSQENIPRVPPPAGLWEWKNMTSVGVY